jgi:aminoglycoside phosphotransferase (APT) family kinase protein
MRRSDWTDFLVDRAAAELTRHEARLEGFNARPQRALKRLRDLADGLGSISMCLVHGDYTLENVMVDAHGAVCAVIDFGALTLVGDPQLDLACAVLFLTGLPGIDSADRAIVRAEAVRLGLTDDALALYTLYYAFRFLGASRDNDSLLRWCAGQIAAAGAH